MPINRLHERYTRLLLSQVRGPRYPSHHILQRLEGVITDRPTAEAYVDAILDEQEARRHPSHHMLERARRIMVCTALADEMDRLERDARAAS